MKNLDRSYENYEIYDCLTVCSNQLINTTNILETSSGWIPLAIRKGKCPRVWLSAPITFDSENNPTEIIELIVNSELKNNRIEFVNTEYGFQIKIDGNIIVEAGNHDRESIEITKMDLTILGLSIKGDVHGLYVGGTTMSRNRSKNSSTFLKV
ncbi:hypothetical protein [Psychrobacter alimentarius]|uniref:hypothetical protein n=1 Tax=Psychrobacter alimentarius TaxID=261164 RepID=UPI00191A9431|nr:hypothetical protein [Psychrobacter alimentarius]